MKVALFGYGKMGKEIETILLDRGHSISHKTKSDTMLNELDFSDTDVVIEFSTPNSAKTNIAFCLTHQLPVVVGTTGWYNHLNEIKDICLQNNGALLYGTNFSIGVNIFFKVNEYLAQIMNKFEDYQCEVKEIHHTEKLDAPSGTGITIANQIIEHLDRLNHWENVSQNELINEQVLPLVSERLPKVPGTHTVKYENDIDKIEFTHTAHNRKGFALGSVLAAEWLIDKTGIYEMKDVFNDIIK
ncbi:MAG TPA: 4-hydroxy-tetrahydrodipicolinate reductase [Crocinitomix sp.]|nr:4-hydroxy-tetrahydrodipicolinate reductase [Crocinitomix sp.]